MKKKSNSLPVSMSSSIAYKPSKADVERERTYRAEEGLRVLQKAEEFRKDKQCMKDIKALAKKHMRIAVK